MKPKVTIWYNSLNLKVVNELSAMRVGRRGPPHRVISSRPCVFPLNALLEKSGAESEAALSLWSERNEWWCLPRVCALTTSSPETVHFRKIKTVGPHRWAFGFKITVFRVDAGGMMWCSSRHTVAVREADWGYHWRMRMMKHLTRMSRSLRAGETALIYAHSSRNKLCRRGTMNEPHGVSWWETHFFF